MAYLSDSRGLILMVDDHQMLCQALVAGLTARGFRCVVADLGGHESVVAQAARLHPALALVDLDLGDVDGLHLIPGLRATGARVLVVTGCRDESRLAAGVALGAIGWVTKSRTFEELLNAVESAARDHPLVAHVEHEELARRGRAYLEDDRELRKCFAQLTAREREVMAAMAAGMTAEDIAGRFVVSVGTVRNHIRAVLTKLGVTSQLAAVVLLQQFAASHPGVDGQELLSLLADDQWASSISGLRRRMPPPVLTGSATGRLDEAVR